MKSIKDVLFILLLILLVALFLVDIAAVIHTTYFSFTHIHLTRMEALFDPNNYVVYKLMVVGATYLVFVILSRWS